LPSLIRATGDKRPIYWLVEAFLEDDDSKHRRITTELADMLPKLQSLLKASSNLRVVA
jgi:hypothetical protein